MGSTPKPTPHEHAVGRAARRRGAAARGEPVRPGRDRQRRRPLPDTAWAALGALSLAVLLFACRGAPLGTPVLDDYSFLDRLTFQHPLDPFDSMGGAFYWRPLSRQLYFSLMGPWLLTAPRAVAALHVLLLVALYAAIFRSARRGFAAPVAAAIAAFPLASEPARVLLGWPSAVQHLLAMLFAAAAIHEALAGRRVTAALAALAGVLSHESVALALPAFPLIAYFRTRRARAAVEWVGVSAAVGALWGAGYRIALAHGVRTPLGGGGIPFAAMGTVLVKALGAALDLEELAPETRLAVAWGYVALAVAAALLAARGRVRSALAARAPVMLGGIAWFALGTLPLAWIWPDWNAWRNVTPSLGLGAALTAALGAASPWLAGGLVVLRAAAVLAAPGAPQAAEIRVPQTVTHVSFERLVRLQRIVDSTRAALASRYARLPHGGVVDFWVMPALSEVGYQGSRALRVWYRDSTLVWQSMPGRIDDAPPAAAYVGYNKSSRAPAVVLDPAALRSYARAEASLRAGRLAEADSLLGAALEAQRPLAELFCALLAYRRARVAWELGDVARADSLNRQNFDWVGESPEYYVMEARVALAEGRRDQAARAVGRALAIKPGFPEAVALGRELAAVGPP